MKQPPSWTRDRGRTERFCTPPCGTLTNSSTWLSSPGEGQLLPVDVGIHKQNATTQLAWFPEASLQLGIRSSLPPLHCRLITLNLTYNSTLCTLPQDQRLPLVVDSWSCCIPSLLKWWATFLYGHFYMVIYIRSFCYVCKVSVNIIKFIRESVLLKHR